MSEYRLSDDDLHRIVNEAGSGNDLSDCVKDLLLAHYELEGLRTAVRNLLEIGKRDLTNQKYDGYFNALKAALDG